MSEPLGPIDDLVPDFGRLDPDDLDYVAAAIHRLKKARHWLTHCLWQVRDECLDDAIKETERALFLMKELR